jgi:hypothetical protein
MVTGVALLPMLLVVLALAMYLTSVGGPMGGLVVVLVAGMLMMGWLYVGVVQAPARALEADPPPEIPAPPR